MERSFIATKESEYFQDLEKHYNQAEEQRAFIIKFFNEKGIEAEEYSVGGSGSVNKPFNEYSKKEIILSIDPTENDLTKFHKMLTKPNNRNGLCSFKKNSAIAKEFAEECIDKRIIINLWSPRIRDYFKSLGWHGCSCQHFQFGDDLYIKINSEYLDSNEVPDGFKEIKLSEYHKVKEEFEEQEQEGINE